jgi:hypothetical protein
VTEKPTLIQIYNLISCGRRLSGPELGLRLQRDIAVGQLFEPNVACQWNITPTLMVRFGDAGVADTIGVI